MDRCDCGELVGPERSAYYRIYIGTNHSDRDILSQVAILREMQSSSIASRAWERPANLLPQMFQGLAHRSAGNFDHAVQRVAHFQDHKNCPRHGQGTDEEYRDDSGVAGS